MAMGVAMGGKFPPIFLWGKALPCLHRRKACGITRATSTVGRKFFPASITVPALP
ncbi:hypothetical protein [Azospirillum isscasi]|uniref:hypothetical protein n=1 Tax=Azospirillum isscasi TaxID=3053926 RepID=UPI0027D1FDCA|nr:hypothetical protein [Azospirillum isscasi]